MHSYGGIKLPTHLCGAGLAFLGFSFSLIIGLWVNNPFVTVVLRGLLVMVLFYVLGCLLSIIGQKVIQENFNNEVKEIEAAVQSREETVSNETVNAAENQTPEASPTLSAT